MPSPNVREIKHLTDKDFENAFQEKLSPYVIDQINKYCFEYEDFSSAEYEKLLIKIIDVLLDPEVPQSGTHRLPQWEDGWAENLQALTKSPGDVEQIVPKYFSKYGAVRWQGKLIKPKSEKFEFYTLAIILDWLFEKYCRDTFDIYEFGCGTGHNLLRIRRLNSHAKLWGLDWASSSQQILMQLNESSVDKKIFGHRFDYFNPDYGFNLAEGGIIYTVASLEQVGGHWQPFLDYILQQRPSLCIHIEPVAELLDENILLDNLSCKYFRKRNYLNGFLTQLRALEKAGKITIQKAQRTGIGSLFIEGYSVIVWHPK